MVNENIIPKTETVYELKNEYKIPSFEEFMQSYENDGNLNYADLNSGDISEAKGYGPCYVCDKPEQWKDLYLPCPGIREGNPCGNPNKTYWYHAPDGGKAEISNRAQIRCKSCSSKTHMSYCSFSCSRHAGEFWSTDKVTFRKSLSTVMGLDCYDDFVDDLVVYMSNHKDQGKSGW